MGVILATDDQVISYWPSGSNSLCGQSREKSLQSWPEFSGLSGQTLTAYGSNRFALGFMISLLLLLSRFSRV